MFRVNACKIIIDASSTMSGVQTLLHTGIIETFMLFSHVSCSKTAPSIQLALALIQSCLFHKWILVEETSGDNLNGKIRSGAPKGSLMLNTDHSPAAPLGGREPPTEKTRVVSTRRRVPTNWVSGRTLQPSIESVVANSFVPSDFLVDDQVSGLGTMHPISL